MRHLPTILLVLALPAGWLAYASTAWVMSTLTMPESVASILTLFIPLFVAGLVMMPFLIPFIDRRAKQDLAAIRATKEAGGESDGAPQA